MSCVTHKLTDIDNVRTLRLIFCAYEYNFVWSHRIFWFSKTPKNAIERKLISLICIKFHANENTFTFGEKSEESTEIFYISIVFSGNIADNMHCGQDLFLKKTRQHNQL
jgi:hypothetical protein